MSSEDLQLAARLVEEAGALAARMRAEGLEGRSKTIVADVVTAADHAAEELVLTTLRKERPQDGVIGEEGTDVPSRSGRTWVIDPVDGTYNFLSGLAYWCSALALRDDDGVLLGAVRHETTEETWTGGRGMPLCRNGVQWSPKEDAELARISLAVSLPPHRAAERDVVEPLMSMLSGAAASRMMGSSSCDLASVAAGRIGAWCQQGLPEWDWLPGRALVESAGGRTDVVEHRGRRWHLAGPPTAVAELRDRLLGS